MKFEHAIDFYENNGVIFNLSTEKYYSLKGKILKEDNYKIYKNEDWKLVAMEHFDVFSCEQILFLKDFFNEKKQYLFEFIPNLKTYMNMIEHAFWRKDDKDIVYCLKNILSSIKPYPKI